MLKGPHATPKDLDYFGLRDPVVQQYQLQHILDFGMWGKNRRRIGSPDNLIGSISSQLTTQELEFTKIPVSQCKRSFLSSLGVIPRDPMSEGSDVIPRDS